MADATLFNYRVFLLRTWKEQPDHSGGRRFSLEDPSTGQRYGFTEAAELVRFLEQVPDQEGDLDLARVTKRCESE
jgi:hypothetical protein